MAPRLARVQRLLQRVEHEVGVHRGADPPADDVAGEHVDDEGDVDEVLPGRDLGEVRHPQPVRPIHLELPVHPVQRARRLGIGHGSAHRLASTRTAQPREPHQPLDGAARNHQALAVQLALDLVGVVNLQVLVVHALHLRQQLGITPGSRRQQRRVAPARRVSPVRRRGDLQRCADRLDPQASAVLVDEGVHLL